MPDPIDPRDAHSTELVSQYRQRLIEILNLAELEHSPSQQEAHRRVADMIREITREIVRLYDRSGSDALTPLQSTSILPTLERLRDILRNAKTGRRALRDTLRKATESNPIFENRVS